MRILTNIGFGIAFAMLASQVSQADLDFAWATIGSSGNAPDPLTGYGSVPTDFRMSKHEVTNAQYAKFLNSVASSDSFSGIDPNLYNSDMAGSHGGILRHGSEGAYSYEVAEGRAEHPVIYVSFFDAMRFANWLHNGQGPGGTETGVYDLTQGTSAVRSADANFFIPSENEWYKAAYHQPSGEGGDTDDYWLYPTSSNIAPIGGSDANFFGGPSTPTPVGFYSSNFYGLFDMGGNLQEINETADHFRGGSWAQFDSDLLSTSRSATVPGSEFSFAGFRIASPVPSPSVLSVLILGAPALMKRRRIG